MQWVQKYRPFTFGEFCGQTLIKTACKNVLEGKDELLNMLFRGPSGTGKSCAIDILCRGLFGDELMEQRVFQISAFDERGINMVREKIKFFSTLKIGRRNTNKHDCLCPDLKVVVIDEIDNLTFDAQTALRNLMESSSRSTRFCMICTNESKVIEPLKSRCLSLPFSKLPFNIILTRLTSISKEERLNVTDNLLHLLSQSAEGDMRKAINTLQTLSRSNALSTSDMFNDISGTGIALQGHCKDKLRAAEHFLRSGGNPRHLLERLSDFVLTHHSSKSIYQATKLLCEIDIGLLNGCDEAISIAHALSVFDFFEDNISRSITS